MTTATAVDLFMPIGIEEMDEYLDLAMEADVPVGFFGAPGIGKTSRPSPMAGCARS